VPTLLTRLDRVLAPRPQAAPAGSASGPVARSTLPIPSLALGL
jgi:hypothetical protein